MPARHLSVLSLLALAGAAAAAEPIAAPVELTPSSLASLMAQANRLAEASTRGDHVTEVKLMHPKLVDAMGGPDEAVRRLAEGGTQMQAQGVEVASARVNELLGCVQVGRALQCALDEVQWIRTPRGLLRRQGDLLAYSDDGGARWRFAPAGSSSEDMREILPETSLALPLRGELAAVRERR